MFCDRVAVSEQRQENPMNLSSRRMKTVGNNNGQDCPQIVAEFLSPNVCLRDSVDPSITEYIVETKGVSGYFELFMSLCVRSTIQVTEANHAFLLSLSRRFGNFDVSISILNYFHTSYPLGQIYPHFGEISIPFLASEFHQLKLSELDNIAVSALYDILLHNELKITSEDSLYWCFSSHFSSDPEYWVMLQFV
jgi:hypothetical protein